jgi:hypothetical protein
LYYFSLCLLAVLLLQIPREHQITLNGKADESLMIDKHLHMTFASKDGEMKVMMALLFTSYHLFSKARRAAVPLTHRLSLVLVAKHT